MLEWVWRKGNPLALLVGMKTVQLLWRRVWRFPKKLGIKLGIKPPYDPAIPLLGIYPKDTLSLQGHMYPSVPCSAT